MRRALTVVAVLLFAAIGTRAQTNVAQPPTFHFVVGASAINFNSPTGKQVGSVAYTGLQLTQSVSATYEHITVPSLSARFEMGVIGYTRPLNELLGKSVSSKLLFDASNMNVTFQGGAGKLLTPTGNHVAETFGASLSYPIPGTSAAIQVLGYQYIHAPNQWGSIAKSYTQQVQSGLIIYF